MGRGRPKKPIEAHKYEGTYRDDRHSGTLEGQVLSIAPRVPGSLKDEGKKEWQRISKLLVRDNLLTDYDLKNLELYCMQFDIIYEANESIREKGVLMKGQNTTIKNPAWQILKESIEIVRKISEKYGFTPVDRAKVNVQKVEEVDELQDILNKSKMRKAE